MASPNLRIALRWLPSRGRADPGRELRVGHTPGSVPPARPGVAYPVELPAPSYDALVAAQALAQEQAIFERRMSKDRQLFRLHMAMGWTTYPMFLSTATAAFVYPIAVVGMLPLTGLAAWNWRRMLRRDTGELEPTTRMPWDIQ